MWHVCMFRTGNMRFPPYFYSGFAWGARYMRFLAILAVLVSPCGPCTCLDQFYKKVILSPNTTFNGFWHITTFSFGCGGQHTRFWAVWSAVVSQYRWLDLIAGMGRFPSQSTSSRNILSNSATGSAPHRGCRHGRIFILTVVIGICTFQLVRAKELVKLVSVFLGLSQKERPCSVVCHVTYCCDRFLGRRSVILQGMTSPYCAAEIGVQLSFLCTHRSRERKSFQTVISRDNLDEAVDTWTKYDLGQIKLHQSSLLHRSKAHF